jgi:nicotinate-nucleotide pyrophosphorylase (carboxylating)
MSAAAFPVDACRRLVTWALEEDIGPGDLTGDAVIPAQESAGGHVIARSPCVVAGLEAITLVYRAIDPRVEIVPVIRDGARVEPNACLAEIAGPARSVLSGERAALNFLQRLSGVATATAAFVERAAPHGVEILDTRKTTPGWRDLEKYAVTVGGGSNHRRGLYDQFLVKENHIRIVARHGPNPIGRAVRSAREKRPDLPVEVEVESLPELEEALEAGAEIVLLDNMDIGEIREAVRITDGRATLEVSGRVTLDNVAEIASTGVDSISVGSLTHSAPAADVSLEIEP